MGCLAGAARDLGWEGSAAFHGAFSVFHEELVLVTLTGHERVCTNDGHPCSLGHLVTNTALRSQNDPFARYVSSLWLLSQIATNLVASNHRH